MVVALDAHVTGCPVTTFPAESLRVAVNCDVAPALALAEAGPTVMEATGTLGELDSGPVATWRSSIHMYWSTGDPSPMYGAIRNWWNWMVGRAPVRNNTSCRSIASAPLNQYCITPSATPTPPSTEFNWR